MNNFPFLHRCGHGPYCSLSSLPPQGLIQIQEENSGYPDPQEQDCVHCPREPLASSANWMPGLAYLAPATRCSPPPPQKALAGSVVSQGHSHSVHILKSLPWDTNARVSTTLPQQHQHRRTGPCSSTHVRSSHCSLKGGSKQKRGKGRPYFLEGSTKVKAGLRAGAEKPSFPSAFWPSFLHSIQGFQHSSSVTALLPRHIENQGQAVASWLDAEQVCEQTVVTASKIGHVARLWSLPHLDNCKENLGGFNSIQESPREVSTLFLSCPIPFQLRVSKPYENVLSHTYTCKLPHS